MNNNHLLWLRQDLRLADNPALQAALENADKLFIVYCHSTDQERPMGGASNWWLHHSLSELSKRIEQLDNQLILFEGKPEVILPQIVDKYGVNKLFFNQQYDPVSITQEKAIHDALSSTDCSISSQNGQLLFEPELIRNQSGSVYKVFTPFWKKGCLNSPVPPRIPTASPTKLPPTEALTGSVLLDELDLLPTNPDWSVGFNQYWQPGELSAIKRLKLFAKETYQNYKDLRNFPAQDQTSRLSPHLHFGEIAPWRIWHSFQQLKKKSPAFDKDIDHFLSELGWREFSYYWIYHFPECVEKSWKESFEQYPWVSDSNSLKLWQQGKTGYPLVDAGMRQLWATGWMHNRVRMVVASFLVKDLRIHWHEGERWFWDTLVDADMASNIFGWQWATGCGADAAPYFRIFNPTLQAERFDPQGDYIRQWVPELKSLPTPWLFKPWEASSEVLQQANINLRKDYPMPIVDHALAKEAALSAYKSLAIK